MAVTTKRGKTGVTGNRLAKQDTRPYSVVDLRREKLRLAGISEQDINQATLASFNVLVAALDATEHKTHMHNGQIAHQEDLVDHRARMMAADRLIELNLGKDKGESQGGGQVAVEIVIRDMSSKAKEIDITPGVPKSTQPV